MEFEESLSVLLVQELVSMGFDENMSRWAVAHCDGRTLEEVVSWMFENQSDYAPTTVSAVDTEGYKMVLIVRSDLGMSAGKIAAQCVHAALGSVQSASSLTVFPWRDSGEATICLKCNTEEELHKFRSCAEVAGLLSPFPYLKIVMFSSELPHHLVCDAGRTEVAPHTHTVLAIGPAKISQINAITGHLKLL